MNYDHWKTTEPDCGGYDPREDEGEPEPAPFVLAPHNASPKGGSRRRFLDGLTREVMVKHFGKPDPNAYWDPENGYDGYEWFFLLGQGDPDVCFNVYERNGCFRVGANTDDETLVEFLAWLEETLQTVLRPS